MDSVIVSGLGKAYKHYPSRRARLAEWVVPASGSRHRLHWVLRNVSFSVQPGEALGILGENGAGKSTLLKIISGTCHPSEGGVTLGGRAAALLELGLGFHPELSGRQNAEMACLLQGWSPEESRRLLPEIRSFSELDEYFDQPLRVFSTGMQMRLAFAVATAQRPDVLIVDEALSVGDARFQHKCMDRIRKYRQQGTTLILVSHDTAAILSICDRALLLDGGAVAMSGRPEDVVDYYNATLSAHQEGHKIRRDLLGGTVRTLSGTGEASIEEVRLLDALGQPLSVAVVGQDVTVQIAVAVNQDIDSLVLGCGIKDRFGQMIFGTNTGHTGQKLHDLKSGQRLLFRVSFAANLGVGSFSVHASLVPDISHIDQNYHWIDRALVFEVLNRDKDVFVGCAWNEMRFVIDRSGG